jgi:hypothetical protein
VLAAEQVIDDLRAVAAPCGPLAAAPPTLRWGLLLAALDKSIDLHYVTALELIYEGYLLHYRESRVSAAVGGPEASLLAGDVLYARGLHLIAASGDVRAVDLLARLMASCSCLRSLEAGFSDDDALWAYTVGGIAAMRGGAALTTVAAVFDRVDEELASGGRPDVRALAREAKSDLGLASATALDAELDAPVSPTAIGVRRAVTAG